MARVTTQRKSNSNDSDLFRKDGDMRWQFGVPPKGNTNFAWVQHFIHHLAPHGMAGFIGVSIGRGACLNEVEITFAMHDNDTFDNSIRHEA